MQTTNVPTKQLRGNPSFQDIEQQPEGLVTLPVYERRNRQTDFPTETNRLASYTWVRELRLIRESPNDPLPEDQEKKLTIPKHDVGRVPPDEPWLDTGGESGESV